MGWQADWIKEWGHHLKIRVSFDRSRAGRWFCAPARNQNKWAAQLRRPQTLVTLRERRCPYTWGNSCEPEYAPNWTVAGSARPAIGQCPLSLSVLAVERVTWQGSKLRTTPPSLCCNECVIEPLFFLISKQWLLEKNNKKRENRFPHWRRLISYFRREKN